MKKVLFFFVAALMMASCAKQKSDDRPDDPMKGWGNNLKYVNGTANELIAGRHINVGEVTYQFDPVSETFNVTYDCGTSGWKVYEAHVFAGNVADMPLNNKKNPNPKVGNFPAHGYYTGGQTTVTVSLPMTYVPCADSGFVVAAHCIVRNEVLNQEETAWAYCPDNSVPFTDKGWGWYDPYTFEGDADPQTILYGTVYDGDSLKLYHINLNTGDANMIMKEHVGSNSGTYDGTAYDLSSGMFFFANYNSKELYVNNMLDDDPSVSSGYITGTAGSATFFNNEYYYVNADNNTLNKVSFFSDWTISGEMVLSEIPDTVITINDIAMSPDGNYVYMVGSYDGISTELITYEVMTDTYFSTTITVNSGVQIAYGSDGILYGVAPISGGTNHSATYIVDTTSGTLTEIEDDVIIIIDDEEPVIIIDLATAPLLL